MIDIKFISTPKYSVYRA